MAKTDIPQYIAAYQFVQQTGADDIAADAYLPDAYDTCEMCVTRETHRHPKKPFVTAEELAEAVASYQRDTFERLQGF